MKLYPNHASALTERGQALYDLERYQDAISTLLKTKPIIGKQATKLAIVKQMANARMIHLATHGLLDDFKGLGVPGAIALAAMA